MALTETDIKAEKTDPARHRWLNDGAGLYLRIAPPRGRERDGRRTWVWRMERNGKTSYVTLGELPTLT